MSATALDVRIARLERTARRDRACALGVLALVLATAQTPSSIALTVRDARSVATLSFNGIAVADAASTVRYAAGIDQDGYAAVDLYDPAGTIRQSMYLRKEGPRVRQFDRNAKVRVELALGGAAEDGSLVLRDEAGTRRAAVSTGARGSSEITLAGSDGNVRTALSAGDDGPSLVMKDRTAAPRLILGPYPSGAFRIDVRNASGAVIWARP